MTQTSIPIDGADARRAAAINIIGRYPDLTPQELDEVLLYLRKQASVLDRAAIASDYLVERQYRELCHDHYLSRPSPMVLIVAVGVAVVLVAVAIFIFGS